MFDQGLWTIAPDQPIAVASECWKADLVTVVAMPAKAWRYEMKENRLCELAFAATRRSHACQSVEGWEGEHREYNERDNDGTERAQSNGFTNSKKPNPAKSPTLRV